MKIKKQKPLKVKIDLFTAKVVLITRKKDLLMIWDHFPDSYHHFLKKDFFGMCVGNGTINYIYLPSLSVSTLAHEVLHVIERICEKTGVDDEETKCYLMHYILESFFSVKG